MVSGIVRQLESTGETEIQSTVVGEYGDEGAGKALDDAGLGYGLRPSPRDFRQTEDFARFLLEQGLADDDKEG